MQLPALAIRPPGQISMAPLDAARQIGSFQGGQQMALQENQRNLLQEVGGQAATGNYLNAAKTAMAGGDLPTGFALQKHQFALQKHQEGLNTADVDKRLKVLDLVSRGAAAAETPEKWDALLGVVRNVYGPSYDLTPYQDFNTRPQVMQFLNNSKEQLELEKLKAQTGQAQSTAALNWGKLASTIPRERLAAQAYGNGAFPSLEEARSAYGLPSQAPERTTPYGPPLPQGFTPPQPSIPIAAPPQQQRPVQTAPVAPAAPAAPMAAPPTTPAPAASGSGAQNDPLIPATQADIDTAAPGTFFLIDGELYQK